MKKLKTFASAALFLCAALIVTSCNDSNDIDVNFSVYDADICVIQDIEEMETGVPVAQTTYTPFFYGLVIYGTIDGKKAELYRESDGKNVSGTIYSSVLFETDRDNGKNTYDNLSDINGTYKFRAVSREGDVATLSLTYNVDAVHTLGEMEIVDFKYENRMISIDIKTVEGANKYGVYILQENEETGDFRRFSAGGMPVDAIVNADKSSDIQRVRLLFSTADESSDSKMPGIARSKVMIYPVAMYSTATSTPTLMKLSKGKVLNKYDSSFSE